MKTDQNRSSECRSAVANESQQWLSLCVLRRHHDVYHLGCPSWGGEMAQLLKCFLCKHEDVSSTPRTHVKETKVLWCVLVIPALGRQTWADHWSLLTSQPSLLSERCCTWEKA